MTTSTKPLAVRNGRAITHYIYRDVKITRDSDYRLFTWTFCRFDLQDFERSAYTLKGAVAEIDKSLASTGRTTGGKLVVTSVENGQIVSALANPDWRYPHARLVSQTEAGK
jgi:hypothetical protein